ncbi:MAG: glycine cleavage system aminomethyltransferase GcvT [Pseudomonadota bacterium]
MKRTPLYQTHVDAGAKMGAYAGFDMPLFYPLGVKKEHLHTRAQAGLFDISHMQQIEVSGSQAADLIARLCPYDAQAQEIGVCKYTFMLNNRAGIIDDLIVTRLSKTRFLIVANAGCADKDIAHVHAVTADYDANATPLQRGLLALQGPLAEAVLTDLGHTVSGMRFMTGRVPAFEHFVSRTGYTGEDGFEISVPISELNALAKQLIADPRVEWVGLAARDALRLEAGLPLYGQDLSEDITPHEAGLLWAIPKNLRDGGAYIGAEALAAKIKEGRRRMRVGLLATGRPVRAGTPVVDENGIGVGTITSGGFGPTINGPMALGLVKVGAANHPLFATVGGKRIPLTLVQPPFTPHAYKRQSQGASAA